jgi:bis(5'-nucleosyl)-tetraphosphatase (symmetrical)
MVIPPPLAFGDLQGCQDAFHRLLALASPTPETPLWFTGDLINRGPASLPVLRDIMALGKRAITVLGNHELHLLAVAAGCARLHHGDTINDILSAPDAAELIDWVRRRPLVHYKNNTLLVHAGVLPQWDLADTLTYAHELECALRAPNWAACVAQLRGAQPNRWDAQLTGYNRLRVIANALTHLRFCTASGAMLFNAKGPPHTAAPGVMPWFDVPDRRTSEITIVCGHWSTLGVLVRNNLCALDSGCVWGRHLSAITLDADPDKRRLMQVACARQSTGQ